MANIGGDRPVRECGLCGIEDDHPRHLAVGTEPGELPVDHHLDCGRDGGCDNCAEKTEGAEGLTGADLLAHLETK